jgi:hypothetical protein
MSESRFFFALPRLVQWCCGRNANRSEKNGLEANVVGALIHLLVYAFAFEICLTSRPLLEQIIWAVPLAFLVFIFWLNFFYLNSLIIRLLRTCGLMRDLPQSRAQGILIGIVTTAFALRLVHASGWIGMLGAIWLLAVSLNLLAAGILAASRAEVR